jgi:hypothetical protein
MNHGCALHALALISLLALASPAAAQQSNCADCHFANPDAPRRDHLRAWDLSAHGREQVGCESCHGGNPKTFDSLPAHQGILRSGDAASPVNRRNLPATCGRCHAGPFVAFQKSGHFELLEKGDTRVPVCVTCHGASGEERPSPRALEAECRECHGSKGVARRPERAESARLMYEGISESRRLLEVAKPLIAHVANKARRSQLEGMYQQAEVPLIQAVHAGHEFVYDSVQERLATARRRIEALLGQLANPK